MIACEGVAALHVQHETGEIIARVNAFLGFNAVGRIRIVQKPVTAEKPRPKPVLRELSQAERKKLSGTVGPIEDEGLRAALERLGARVLGGKGRNSRFREHEAGFGDWFGSRYALIRTCSRLFMP